MNLPYDFSSDLIVVAGPIACLAIGGILGTLLARSRWHSAKLGLIAFVVTAATVAIVGAFLAAHGPEDPLELVWAEPVLIGLGAGAIVGGSLLLSHWIGLRFLPSAKARRRLALCMAAFGFLSVTGWTTHVWVSKAMPYMARVQDVEDFAEARAGRGPFVATPSDELVDRVFPDRDTGAPAMAAMATLAHRFRTGTLAPDAWQRLLSRDFANRPLLLTRRRVAPGAPVWADVPSWSKDFIGGRGRAWRVVVAADLPEASPIVLSGPDPWPPEGPQLLGRAPEAGSTFNVRISIDELDGPLHTSETVELPLIVDLALSKTLIEVSGEESTAWVRENVTIRFTDDTRTALRVKRVARTMHGVVTDEIGVGFRINFLHREEVIAHSYAYALHFTNSDSDRVSFPIVGDTTVLAQAALSALEWRVSVASEPDWAMAERQATHYWLGEFSVPLSELASE